jgi:hypothetical protein
VTEQRASRSRRTAACRCRRAREEVATHRPTSLVDACRQMLAVRRTGSAICPHQQKAFQKGTPRNRSRFECEEWTLVVDVLSCRAASRSNLRRTLSVA